jgi:hypothetical protein
MPTIMADPIRYYQQPVCDVLDDSGVDWITVTQANDRNGAQLLDAAEAILDLEADAGNDMRQGVWQGYNTIRCGGAMMGERADTVVAQLTGQVAARHWASLVPLARNVSRMDFQCTGRYRVPRPDLARDSFAVLPERPYDRGRPRRAGLIAYQSKGDTLMLGSRASLAYGRHYDKGVESKTAEPGRVWRWELELKREQAKSTAISMDGMDDPSPFIQSLVYSWFWRWGLKPGFRPQRSP